MTGGSPVPVATASGHEVSALAADASGVYFFTVPAELKHVPLTGGTPTPLYTHSAGYVGDIALDAGAVYWTHTETNQPGSVYKLAK